LSTTLPAALPSALPQTRGGQGKQKAEIGKLKERDAVFPLLAF
jgi:hypothetical protein